MIPQLFAMARAPDGDPPKPRVRFDLGALVLAAVAVELWVGWTVEGVASILAVVSLVLAIQYFATAYQAKYRG